MERADRKIHNLKINQSSSTTERKNITFFDNYIKNNKIYNNNINTNRYYTNGNLSSYINNKSEIIRNILYNKALLREEKLLKKIKLKIKSKALTTMNSKDNLKSNIFYENFINTSIKNPNNYTTTNINNKNVKGNKKIFYK